MIDNTIARPYADAAYDYAKAHNQVEAWQVFLMTLSAVFENQDIQKVLHNPFVSQEDFANEITKVLANSVNASQTNFLKTLASNRRMAYIQAIAQLFQARCEEVARIMHVTVTTALPLQEGLAKALIAKLSSKYQKEIKMHANVDPSLIGGMVIRMGDYILDSSVKGMLAELQKEMVR